MDNKEVCTKIREDVEKSYQALRPAIGQRHFVVGTNTLYWDILKAETALLSLLDNLKKEIEK